MSPRNDDHFDERLHDRLATGAAFSDESSENEIDSDLVLDPDEDDAADLALMHEALGSYKSETLRFAEQQSAAMPAPRVNRALALWDSTPRWVVASAAVLALGFSTVFVTHRTTEPAPLAMAAAPTAQALADDNQLLLSVNEALTANVAPSEQDLGLTAIPTHDTKRGRATN